MKINIYANTCPFQERADALSWLTEGISKMEPTTEINIIEGFRFAPADVSIMYGIYKPWEKDTKLSHKRCTIAAGAKFTNTPLFILEMPIFGRNFNGPINQQQDSYRITEGHALGLGRYHIGDSNRWGKVSKRYKIRPNTVKTKGIIGIASQRVADRAMFGKDIFEWIDETIATLRTKTDDVIGIKYHSMENRKTPAQLYNDVLNKYENVSLIKDISICRSLITYTSNIAVDAIVAGIPVISCHQGNFLYDYSSHNVLDAINPTMENRLDILRSLSYLQWSKPEMQSGVAWKHMRKII